MTLFKEKKRLQKELDDMKEKFESIVCQLKTLNEKHPSYGERWINEYNKAREKLGIPTFSREDIDKEYTQEYVNLI